MMITFLSDHTYIPDRSGGRESSIHDLSLALIAAGFDVSVVAKKAKRFALWMHPPPHQLPYPVARVRNPIDHVCKSPAKNGILIANLNNRNISSFAEKYKNPSAAIFFRDALDLECVSPDLTRAFILFSNSKHLSDILSGTHGLKTSIFPPFVEPSQYSVIPNGPYVTFINPVLKKGLDIAKAVAEAMPDLKFQFVESWPLDKKTWRDLEDFASNTSNVRLMRQTTDMRSVYKTTRVLFVPSFWEEAWGRVVTEAQFSKIPAVVSDSGGLRRVAGNGGLVVSRDAPIMHWVEALRSAYADGPDREDLVQGARRAADNYIEESRASFQNFLQILRESKNKLTYAR